MPVDSNCGFDDDGRLEGDGRGARPSFARLRDVFVELRERTGLPMTELSMGMSNDFEVAIEEGRDPCSRRLGSF